jgi:hypothetical protein
MRTTYYYFLRHGATKPERYIPIFWITAVSTYRTEGMEEANCPEKVLHFPEHRNHYSQS